jgi:hypothetical protein
MRTLLVGLDNTQTGDPTTALHPLPETGSGGRIVDLIRAAMGDYNMGMYLRDFHRVNLYPGKLAASGKGATKMDRLMAAWCTMYAVEAGYDNIVVFGNRVRSAFAEVVDLSKVKNCDCLNIRLSGRLVTFWVVPHPSGRNRWYNDFNNCELVGELLFRLRERRRGERNET